MNDVMLRGGGPYASPWPNDADEDEEAPTSAGDVARILALASAEAYRPELDYLDARSRVYEILSATTERLEHDEGSDESALEVCALGYARAIEAASKLEDAASALAELDEIWRQLDELGTKVEARFRLRLSTEVGGLAKSPQWLQDEVARLRGAPNPPHSFAIQSAERLVAKVLSNFPDRDDLRVELSAAPLGRVEVEWLGRNELRWVVGPIGLPWPGVLVRAYQPGDGDSLRLRAVTYHHADHVVSHAIKALTTNEPNDVR